jgi:glycosyltransferase involved in cell wall biosynthesis
MKKVLFLNSFDDPHDGGGAEVILCRLAEGFALRGLEAVILSTWAGAGFQRISRNGVRIIRAGIRNIYWPDLAVRQRTDKRMLWHLLDSYNPFMQHLLRHVLKSERPDVVEIHNLPGWSAAAWKTIADMRIPSIQVLHGCYALCAKSTMHRNGGNCKGQCADCRLFRLAHRRLSSHVCAVVGVSGFVLDRHISSGYFTDVPIKRVLHNACDREHLGIGVLASLVRTEEDQKVRIGFIGRVEAVKGIELLLENLASLEIPKVELLIAGGGKTEYVKSLQSRFESECIRFVGRVSPRDFYRKVDFIVVPSLLNDTFPTVVLEALAFGKPVIGSRRGGIPEIILHGRNGLLFEPDRPGELSAALECLAGDAGLREKMSEAARASAERFLDHDAWVSSHLDLCREVSGVKSLKFNDI